jgi:hypothetical protein
MDTYTFDPYAHQVSLIDSAGALSIRVSLGEHYHPDRNVAITLLPDEAERLGRLLIQHARRTQASVARDYQDACASVRGLEPTDQEQANIDQAREALRRSLGGVS